MQFCNESVEMDPNVARQLFKTGGVLIMTGVPVGTEFGIDLTSYEVGERFRGVKMIPPGVHYVFCAAKDTYGDSAPRVGFVHYFKQAEIVVREWDSKNEELRYRQCQDIDLEEQHIRDNLENLDRFLAPYDYENLRKWNLLTDTITEEVMNRCKPRCGFIKNSMDFLSCPDSDRPRGDCPRSFRQSQHAMDENDLLPNLKPIPETALNFLNVPARVPSKSTPSQITQHNMDCIEAASTFFAKFPDASEVIQEIQLAFIFFCSGYSVDGLSHWRRILNILSNSEIAVNKYKLFYMKYLEVLQHQLPELPEELMEPGTNNTVYKDVRSLLRNCSMSGLHVSAERTIKRLKKSMNWNFSGLSDEDPEDMPVIVDDVE